MKHIVCGILTALSCLSLSAFDLSIASEDVRIIQSPEGGYHLYVRKKGDIQSILLTETTRDPALKADNYAYRVPEYNPINGDEKRMLDGSVIPPEKKIYSLIDSTPDPLSPIGQAYHVWIPYVIQFGYEWSRNGEVQVLDGTYINIRTFSKPYADYSGSFADNPFRLRLTQKAVVKTPPEDSRFMSETVAAFGDLAVRSSGKTLYAKNPDEIIPLVKDILIPAGKKTLDLVFVIDATESMQDDIKKMRELLEGVLSETLNEYPSYRIALVLYKDYFEDFLVKSACAFTSDLSVFRKALNGFHVQGGRDIPEAVYEAIDGALAYPWNPEADKKIILIGDAPPHPKPRGRVTKEIVDKASAAKQVQVNVIILPHGTTD